MCQIFSDDRVCDVCLQSFELHFQIAYLSPVLVDDGIFLLGEALNEGGLLLECLLVLLSDLQAELTFF